MLTHSDLLVSGMGFDMLGIVLRTSGKRIRKGSIRFRPRTSLPLGDKDRIGKHSYEREECMFR